MSVDKLSAWPITTYDASDMEELACFRYQAWEDAGINTALFPDQSWSDEHDSIRSHWVVRDPQGKIIASASLGVHEHLDQVDEAEVYLQAGFSVQGPVGAPARVTVLAEYRKHGYASRLLDVQDSEMRNSGVHLAVRQSSPAMQRLLIARGWTDHGPAPVDIRFPETPFHIMSLKLR